MGWQALRGRDARDHRRARRVRQPEAFRAAALGPGAAAPLRCGPGAPRLPALPLRVPRRRVAEATDRRELALHYYQESLATRRNPIIALWPLYDDLTYRVRRLAANPA